MSAFWIIVLAVVYLLIGRLFVQLYHHIKGYSEFHSEFTDVIETIFWPILAVWWGVVSFAEWFDDIFF